MLQPVPKALTWLVQVETLWLNPWAWRVSIRGTKCMPRPHQAQRESGVLGGPERHPTREQHKQDVAGHRAALWELKSGAGVARRVEREARAGPGRTQGERRLLQGGGFGRVQRQRARLAQGRPGPGAGAEANATSDIRAVLLTLGCGGREESAVAHPIQGWGRQGYALAAFTFTLYF